jgi:hypothetical protein
MERIGSSNKQGDEGQYASAPYEQFPQYAYEFMFSRARSTRHGQRVRIVSSANPVGEGVEWITQRWSAWIDEGHPNLAKPGELRWYKRDDEGNEIETSADDPDGVSRTFIPAGLKDNPYLGDDYRRMLNLLPEPLRSALLDGDWKASITDDAYQVVPRTWVKAAQARWRPNGRPKDDMGAFIPMTCLGADIARGGQDKEVLSQRYGNWFAELVKISGASVPDGARAIKPVIDLLEQLGEATRTERSIEYKDAGIILPIVVSNTIVNVDVIGVGSSAYDTARTHGLFAKGVNFAEKTSARDASGRLGFVNVRAECWWKMREALDPNSNADIALPPDPELLADLCAPRWEMQTNGIKIESKEDIKDRLGRSPDCGDAVVLANHIDKAQIWI